MVATVCACIATAVLAASSLQSEEIEVRSFRLEGVEQVDEGRLRSVLVTRAPSIVPWRDRPRFDRRVFEADLKRIVAYYNDRGYPDARIAQTDVRPTDDQKGVHIVVRVAEGSPLLVERLDLAGFDILGDRVEPLNERAAELVGGPADANALRSLRERGIAELRDYGYPSPSVALEERTRGTGRVTLALVADPGLRANFGPVDVVGVKSVGEAIVTRQLTYKPGDLFSAGALRQSQRELSRLELFEFARVEAVPAETPGADVRTRVTLTEGKPRRLSLSAGYGSEEHLRGEIDWRHVNFLGGARTGGVHAKWSSLTRGVRARLSEPYFFSPRYTGQVEGGWWVDDEPAYVLESRGIRLTMTRPFEPRRSSQRRNTQTKLVAWYTLAHEDYRISDEALADPASRDDLIALGLNPDTGEGSGLVSAVGVEWLRANLDDLIDATSGYQVSLRLEQAGRWPTGDFTYTETVLEVRHYWTIPGRAVLATRARGGAFAGPDPIDQNVPFPKRYFLGGSTSLRGWGRFEVGPINESGVSVGGLTSFEASAEVRFPVWKRLGGVVFLDGGNTWDAAWRFYFDELRSNAGLGLRYRTPVGPVRFDVGYQLTKIPGLMIDGEPEQRHWRVHVSIGQAF
jgi:outer membrane protein assembly complex protein YaeT